MSEATEQERELLKSAITDGYWERTGYRVTWQHIGPLMDAILESRWLAAHDEQVRNDERERCLKAVERQAERASRDINISQYREGLNDGVWCAVSAIDRLPAIRAVSEQEEQ